MTDQSTASEKKKARSAEEIQSEIEETRQRLTRNISQLRDETKPQVLVGRAKRAVTDVFIDHETGMIRVERVAAVAGVVVGLLVVRRGFKARSRRREIERLSAVVWVPVPKSSVSREFAGTARTAAELAPPPEMLALAAAE